MMQDAPDGQPSPGLASHPGTQKPPGPLQTKPTFVPQAPPLEEASQPQMPRSGKHAGLRPPHALPLAAEHCVHAPASGPVR